MPRKGKSKRPVIAVSLREVPFKRVIQTKKRINRVPAHPLVVINDLRRGCLDSLAIYLKEQQGIPDREVAHEVRKLLNGSSRQTPFRVVVIDHPDAPPDLGGRPKSKSHYPTRRDFELTEVYREQFDKIGKVVLAREQAAEKKTVSPRTIQRAVRKVEAHEASESERKALAERRAAALAKLAEQSQN